MELEIMKFNFCIKENRLAERTTRRFPETGWRITESCIDVQCPDYLEISL